MTLLRLLLFVFFFCVCCIDLQSFDFNVLRQCFVSGCMVIKGLCDSIYQDGTVTFLSTVCLFRFFFFKSYSYVKRTLKMTNRLLTEVRYVTSLLFPDF